MEVEGRKSRVVPSEESSSPQPGLGVGARAGVPRHGRGQAGSPRAAAQTRVRPRSAEEGRQVHQVGRGEDMSESVSALCNLKVKRLRLLCVGDSGAQVEAPGGTVQVCPRPAVSPGAPHSPAQPRTVLTDCGV